MNAERIVRIVAGFFILLSLSLRIGSQPDIREQILFILHRFRWSESVPKRLYADLSAE